MPATAISALPALSQTALTLKDVLAVVSIGGSETKKITAEDFVLGVVADLPDDAIDGAKVDIDLTGVELETDNLKDGIVTAEKLDDNSSWVVAATSPAAGEFIGQALLNTTTGYAYVWNGTAWTGYKAVNSINTISVDNADRDIQLTATKSDDEYELKAAYGTTNTAAHFVAGPTSAGGTITQRAIASGDLPAATTTDKGAVSAGSGLAVDTDGVISIDNTVTEQTDRSLATWDANGLVTGGGPIQSSDLPLATDTTPGAITPGEDLTVTAGELVIDNSVTAGSYPKVTVNGRGLVTAGLALTAADLPTISLDDLTGGTIGTTQIDDDSVTAAKLGDYATTLIQEDHPGSDPSYYLGMLWFKPSTTMLSVFVRGSGSQNMWMSIGLSGVAGQQLRWCGTYNATTAQVVAVTAIGTQAGFLPNSTIPTATDSLSGAYLLCVEGGSSISVPNLDGITHSTGDWIACIGAAQGWLYLDVASGSGGGGGGAGTLAGLTDVTISGSVTDEDLLQYTGATGQWENTSIIDGGSF